LWLWSSLDADLQQLLESAMGRHFDSVVFDATYYPAAAVSCVFFLYLFKFVSPTISAKMFEKYTLLSEEQKLDWNTR